MIEYIKGALEGLTPSEAVVECSGVGYSLQISLVTYSAIQGKREAKLYVHEQLVTGGRDDSLTLFGFASRDERELFRLLMSVSGVGANTARMILSALSPAELSGAIASGDERVLKSIKGIGPKAAQRIILELKDKILRIGSSEFQPTDATGAPQINKETRDEAVGALTMLGFSPAPTAKVVGEIMRQHPSLTVEQVVKRALKMM